MAEITANMVNELRRRTGAGIMECKKALQEAQGELEVAEDIIAKSGSRKAAKSAAKTAAEGRIIITQSDKIGIMIEINCQTDFVAREETFINFTQQVAKIALDNQVTSLEALLEIPFDSETESVEVARQNMVAKIGENIQIRRLVTFNLTGNQYLGSYVHNAKMAAMVILEGGTPELAKDMAMQVVANKAQYIKPEDVPAAVTDKEKDILIERSKQSGKPADIAEKMVQGQLKKYLDEICLVGQPFFKDPEKVISAVLKAGNAQVKQIVRFEVGEGIEVIKKSFEEEVMEQVKGSRA
jgi:elongation factor Ts